MSEIQKLPVEHPFGEAARIYARRLGIYLGIVFISALILGGLLGLGILANSLNVRLNEFQANVPPAPSREGLTFELFCIGLIGLAFGAAMVFVGYRLFLVLLPIWGFFFGFGLGAHTIQVILGEALLTTVSGWIVGFIMGMIFAVLSYLFYLIAVTILSFSFGYVLTVGMLTAIGLESELISWILGVIFGVVTAGAVLALNIQKYAIIVITAIAGTGVTLFTIISVVYGPSATSIFEGQVYLAFANWGWMLPMAILIVSLGIVVQLRDTQYYEIEAYNRMGVKTAEY